MFAMMVPRKSCFLRLRYQVYIYFRATFLNDILYGDIISGILTAYDSALPNMAWFECRPQTVSRPTYNVSIGVSRWWLALGSQRAGSHRLVRITQRYCPPARTSGIPRLLCGIYSLQWPRRTLPAVERETQRGSPTINSSSARRWRQKLWFKEFQQPENEHFCFSFFFVYCWVYT